MTYLSLFEKIKILFNTIFDFKVVLIFSIILLVLTVLYTVKVLDKKKYTISMFGSFITVFAVSIISNFKILSKTFDNFTTIFFRNIYFPSIYVYIAILVINLITFITSILSKKLNRVYKIINSINFILGNVILVTILNIIAKNKIDIFSISSLYTNTSLVAVLELSMNITILWLLSLLGVYTTNTICDRILVKNTNKKEIVEPVMVIDAEDIQKETLLDKVKEVVKSLKKNKVVIEAITNEDIEDNISEIELDEEIDNISEIEEVTSLDEDIIEEITEVKEDSEVIEEAVEDKITFNDLLNGCIAPVYYDNSENMKEEYTLSNPEDIFNEPVNNVLSNAPEVKIIKQNEVEEIEDSTNTISLDDFIKGENIIEEVKNDFKKDIVKTITENDIKEEEITNNDKYSLDDYKKMINMLKELKSLSHTNNISIDEAVTLSLISDYSIDDCLKFKEILESNLN